jgi:hypothetical protein
MGLLPQPKHILYSLGVKLTLGQFHLPPFKEKVAVFAAKYLWVKSLASSLEATSFCNTICGDCFVAALLATIAVVFLYYWSSKFTLCYGRPPQVQRLQHSSYRNPCFACISQFQKLGSPQRAAGTE